MENRGLKMIHLLALKPHRNPTTVSNSYDRGDMFVFLNAGMASYHETHCPQLSIKELAGYGDKVVVIYYGTDHQRPNRVLHTYAGGSTKSVWRRLTDWRIK